ncbi:MAG: superfamily II DNA/RNA helicase [Porticoccaceae bacterium]|jgi:superfamily II DNA/RNA helicase
MPDRDEIALEFLDQIPYEPYPVQEDAILKWFDTEQGVLVSAPTGMGKTLIAEAALFEALHTGQTAYYTTPLIALTDQKFQEIQEAAVRWGFQPEDVGLVTGNHKVNPDAKVLVVVAEILLNRLLNRDDFDFSEVSSVVMDEFHSFNDPERGIVWELSLSLLPKHVRLMLLSATVGNSADFMIWLNRSHGRRLDLVRSEDRKVPLRYHWVPDQLLNEQLEMMADGDDDARKTPTLLFCFNREECWSVAEQLKGKALLSDGQQKLLVEELKKHEWSQGIGPKLKTIILRGVGVHHAGVLPRYKRIIEYLFQQKLLTVCVCTETLAAGMNLPARSVLMTDLLKGPPGKKTLIDPSVAHQIFGRAGRPQFDTEGHVFALSHEDDVKIHRYKLKMDQIPEDTKDPLLMKKRKQMKKKMPSRRSTVQYWNEAQFTRLIEAPPTKLQSQGFIPWRLLAYLISRSPDVSLIRTVVSKRLMNPKQLETSQKRLIEMLITLHRGGFIQLNPKPPIKSDSAGDSADPDAQKTISPIKEKRLRERLDELNESGAFGPQIPWDGTYGVQAPADDPVEADSDDSSKTEEEPDGFGTGIDQSAAAAADSEHPAPESADSPAESTAVPLVDVKDDQSPTEEAVKPALSEPEKKDAPKKQQPAKLTSSLKILLEAQGVDIGGTGKSADGKPKVRLTNDPAAKEPDYEPQRAYPNEPLTTLLSFKSINPLYGTFLLDVLPFASGPERVQALESVLVFPGAVSRNLRIPRPDVMPLSPFATDFLNPELLQRGLATITELGGTKQDDDENDERGGYREPEEWVRPLNFPEKLLRLFRSEYPGVSDVRMTDVWAAGELLNFGGDFNKLVTTRKIAKQEGILFRHILRFVLLCEEFVPHVDPDSVWHGELHSISHQLTEACREIDPRSTDMMIESAHAVDPLLAETPAVSPT